MTSSDKLSKANPAKLAKRSTTSWKTPEPGDVLNYAFLWNHEARRGLTEGLKDRPCVVVVSVEKDACGLNVIVCPLSSQLPDLATTIEIPAKVKKHLLLTDREKSYAVTSEINTFVWPGPDLRPIDVHGRRDVYYGQIPGDLLIQIRDSIVAHARGRTLKSTPRG